MAGKQAKVLTNKDFIAAYRFLGRRRHKHRDRVILLLSVKAGLRAGEIAKLTWPMVLAADGKVGTVIELHDGIAKKGSGRTIPMNPDLRSALVQLHRKMGVSEGPVIRSERGGPMPPESVVNWFGRLFGQLGLQGCSSHSGRRTFITLAARQTHKAGASLRDVQQLAGHKSIDVTQRYIEGDTRAKQRLVALI